ncbi:MAG: phage baseplate assembly protein V [Candidatus Hydrogenedens sp.]|nr:phage baseplate assembly protein V [Candidatus Hydrogenedens sp.]
MTEALWQYARDTAQRVRLALARAVLNLVDDTTPLQTLQVGLLAEETRGYVEYFHPYGLTTHPVPGAEVAMLFLAGNRDHPVAVAVADRRSRVTGLKEGEVCLYSKWLQRLSYDELGQVELVTAHGQRILLGEGGQVDITTASGSRVVMDGAGDVAITAGTVRITGDVEVSGNLNAGGSVIDGAGNTNHHSH